MNTTQSLAERLRAITTEVQQVKKQQETQKNNEHISAIQSKLDVWVGANAALIIEKMEKAARQKATRIHLLEGPLSVSLREIMQFSPMTMEINSQKLECLSKTLDLYFEGSGLTILCKVVVKSHNTWKPSDWVEFRQLAGDYYGQAVISWADSN